MGHVGRALHLNMGVLEMATREWIAETQGEAVPVITAPLAKRIEFIQKEIPRGMTQNATKSP